MRVRVNPIACDGHGLCVELLPELFRLDDWGYPIIDQDAVPRSLESIAKMAADACPTLAIVIEQQKP
jgi:ferredoxin